jgi:haloalkane dehalogenase
MDPNGHQSPAQAAQPSGRAYREHWVPRGPYQLSAREHPGQEPTIVLMHGFPDDLHLYDRLVPQLAGRRLVTFDFLGWGASDKPTGYPYTAANQTGDLDAVLEHLQLGSVVLVAHDASGPPAINWALDHPQRVAALVLLNTYYARMPGLRPPEASAHEAFFGLNRDLLPTVAAGTATVPRLRHFGRPVRIIFGAADPYLNAAVARRFHELFPTSELFLLEGARHYVQLDEPQQVARLILTTPQSG